MSWLPNFLTLLRLAAAPIVVWLLYSARYRDALLVVMAAGVTDWLDGYAARKLGSAGEAGVLLDPLADKVLVVSVFVSLGFLGLVPFWLFALTVGRDLVIVLGSLLLRLLRNRKKFLPTILGKISTFFQIILALLTLLLAAFPNPILGWLKDAGVLLAAIFTLWSGLDYVKKGVQMARLPPLKTI